MQSLENSQEGRAHRMTRRRFLTGMGALLGSAVVGGLSGCLQADREDGIPEGMPLPINAPAPAAERPNFLFILTDDHRWDHIGAVGHPFLQTPNLDRLVREGVLFQNAFVTTALCGPSRASYLTGMYARTHGVQNNLTAWHEENVTFPELLAAAGYRSGYIGKWHMPGRLPNLRGVDPFISFTVQEGQGRYFDCPLIMNGVEVARPGAYITEDLTNLALEFLRQQSGSDRPFCLYLAHKAAHQPFSSPPDLDTLYDDAPLDHLPPEQFTRQTVIDHNFWEGAAGSMERHYRNYCETIVGVDRELGRLLDEMAQLELLENTVIVYAGDNGFSWGEHVLNGKRWASEENMRVPFIVRMPRMLGGTADDGQSMAAGRSPSAKVLNVDLAPTFLDLAGLSIPSWMQGRTLRPLLMGEESEWRDAFLYEYFRDFPYQVPAHKALRTERYLYVMYERGRPDALFDIAADPRTLHNIIDTPAGQAALPALREQLQAEEARLS